MSTTAQDDTAAIKGKENQKGATDSSLPALPLNEVTGEFMDEIIEEEDGTRYTERLKRVKRPSIKLNIHIHDREFVLNVGNKI